MADDPLLRALGRSQREPSAGPEMDALAEDVLRPFDDDEREALLDGVMAKLDAEPVPLAERRRSRWPIVGAIVALAAAAVLWLAVRPFGSTPDLPEYRLTRVAGGVAELRGADDELPAAVELGPNAVIDWVITPAQRFEASVGAALLATGDGAQPQYVRLPGAQISEQGAVRIQGRLSEYISLSPGDWTLSILIAPPEALPPDVSTARQDPAGRWRVVTIHAAVVP